MAGRCDGGRCKRALRAWRGVVTGGERPTADGWPAAALGTVQRMAVLATALPGAHLEERQVAASFEFVWSYLSDIEHSIPEFDESVAALRITDRDGPHLKAQARTAGPVGLPMTFDIELRPGWCWMVARPGLYIVGFAAEPAGDQTRLAHLEALHVPGPEKVRRALRPVVALPRRRIARHVGHDLDGIERALSR